MGILTWLLKKLSNKNRIENMNKSYQRDDYGASNQPLKQERIGAVSIKQVSIDKNTMETLRDKFISLDVETTGLSPASDKVIEIGATMFIKGTSVKRFESLINIGERIPLAAQRINHITDEMLLNSPDETKVISDFVDFLGDAISEGTIVCAHNARFDLSFISETLIRNGYSGNIQYIDTLNLSRKYIKGLPNYKLNTIVSYFGISNDTFHRALADANSCGEITLKILNLIDEDIRKEDERLKKSRPSQEELEVCAYIQNSIIQSGGDSEWMGFYKNSGSYVDISYIFSLMKFKFAKKGRYIIVEAKEPIVSDLRMEPCTMSEGGADFVRIYFDSVYELEVLADYFYKKYKNIKYSASDFLKNYRNAEEEAINSIAMKNSLDKAQVKELLNSAKSNDESKMVDSSMPNEKIVLGEVLLKREDYQIRASNSRCELDKIRNSDNWDKGYDEGVSYWEYGEVMRKEGDLLGAIQNFDIARQNGYVAPALYESYGKTYRKLKDFANEICILDEGILRLEKLNGVSISKLVTRRDSALKLYLKEEQVKQKREAKIEGGLSKEKRATKGKREVIQLTSDGQFLNRFESIAQAVRETGVNSKSIRDAANGVQKHAGGYKWQFTDIC